MAVTSIISNGGVFRKKDINTINDNFTSLSASTAGGTMVQGIDWYEVQIDLG